MPIRTRLEPLAILLLSATLAQACSADQGDPSSSQTVVLQDEDMNAPTPRDMSAPDDAGKDMREVDANSETPDLAREEECADNEVKIRTAQQVGDGVLEPGCYSTCAFDSDCEDPTPTCYEPFSQPICVPASVQPPGPPCGDGVVQEGELCDGNCPESALECPPPDNACQKATLEGDPRGCDVSCSYEDITACMSADGCCPAGCSWENDRDCVREDVTTGVSCKSDLDCATEGVSDPVCFRQLPVYEGYCTANCNSHADCAGDGICGQSGESQFCYDQCQENSDCRPGYSCHDYGTYQLCWYDFGEGLASPGAPCETALDCGDGEICRPESDGFRGGYCTKPCATGEPCSTPNTNCVAFTNPGDTPRGFCGVRCTSDADCREGYGCNVGGTGVCFPIASGDGKAGDPCESAVDCAGGRNGYCLPRESGYPDGMCTTLCSTFDPCREQENCTSFGQTRACLAVCANDLDCRPGYLCYDLDNNGSLECVPPFSM